MHAALKDGDPATMDSLLGHDEWSSVTSLELPPKVRDRSRSALHRLAFANPAVRELSAVTGLDARSLPALLGTHHRPELLGVWWGFDLFGCLEILLERAGHVRTLVVDNPTGLADDPSGESAALRSKHERLWRSDLVRSLDRIELRFVNVTGPLWDELVRSEVPVSLSLESIVLTLEAGRLSIPPFPTKGSAATRKKVAWAERFLAQELEKVPGTIEVVRLEA